MFLHIEDYTWAPVLGVFDKLHEVGVLSYSFYTLFKCFVMFELIEAVRGRLICNTPKYTITVLEHV